MKNYQVYNRIIIIIINNNKNKPDPERPPKRNHPKPIDL